MKITVLGATGRTGRPLVDQLLNRGHDVTVLVRSPERLADQATRLHVVTGTTTDPAALAEALAGADAVVSALGPTKSDPRVMSATARQLVPAMQAAGVSRFVGISGAGQDVPGDRKGRKDRVISAIIQRTGGELVADKAEEYQIWSTSGLAWTLVRPPMLRDGEATGNFVHDAHQPGRSSSIKRADLATFLADTVEHDVYVGQAPFVSSR
jgi:putative NADH-flavin reductase